MKVIDREEVARQRRHPSPRSIESFAFDPPENHRQTQLSDHIDECERCQQRVEQLRSERDGFLTDRPAAPFIAALSRGTASEPSRRFRWLALAAAVLLAVGTGVYLGIPRTPDPSSVVQFKGGKHINFTIFVGRDGAPARPRREAEPLYPGDVIRFGVAGAQSGYLYIANLDGENRFTRYYPADKPASAPVLKSERQILEGSIVLDEYLGPELIIIFWSKQPLDDATVRRAVTRAFDRAGGELERVEVAGIDAVVIVKRIRKVARR